MILRAPADGMTVMGFARLRPPSLTPDRRTRCYRNTSICCPNNVHSRSPMLHVWGQVQCCLFPTCFTREMPPYAAHDLANVLPSAPPSNPESTLWHEPAQVEAPYLAHQLATPALVQKAIVFAGVRPHNGRMSYLDSLQREPHQHM
jgi:hypothetical protein